MDLLRNMGMSLIFMSLATAPIYAATEASHATTKGAHKATPLKTNHHVATNSAHYELFTTNNTKWSDAPAALPKGAQIAILSGDPTRHGLFTIRLKFPANYHIAPHWHPTTENIIVISGTFNMGTGDKIDQTHAMKLPSGSFLSMKAKTNHFAFTQDEDVVVQVYGEGPFQINYVNASDDPRNAKMKS